MAEPKPKPGEVSPNIASLVPLAMSSLIIGSLVEEAPYITHSELDPDGQVQEALSLGGKIVVITESPIISSRR